MEALFWIVALVCILANGLSTQLSLWLIMREVRLMGAALPEKDRERWINAALASIDHGLSRPSWWQFWRRRAA